METVISAFVHPILEVLVGLTLALIAAAAGKAFKRFGLEAEAQQFFKNRELAKAVVLKVEEEVEALVKRAPGTFLPGGKAEEKSDRAVDALLDKIPSLSAEEAKELADEAVARVPGLGSTPFLGEVVPAAAISARK